MSQRNKRSLGVRFHRIVPVLVAWATITLITGSASAQPTNDQERKAIVLGTVRAATDCITLNVSRFGITAQSANGPLSDAIRTVFASRVCDDTIRKMVGTFDRVNGPGTGVAFFSGPYGSDLPRAVKARLENQQSNEGQASRERSRVPVEPPTSPYGSHIIRVPVQTAPTAAQTMVLPQASSGSSIATSNSKSDDPSRPRTPEETASDKAFAAMLANAAGIVGLAGGATFILFLIGLGSRWVVFADGMDLTRTAIVLLGPLGTALVAGLEIARLGLASGEPVPPLSKAFVLDHPSLIVILVIGAIATLWGLITTFTFSIRHNGIAMGFSIAILRIVAALFTPIGLFGLMQAYDLGRSEKRPGNGIGGWIVIGIFIWFGTKLINGNRVIEQRNMVFEQAYE